MQPQSSAKFGGILWCAIAFLLRPVEENTVTAFCQTLWSVAQSTGCRKLLAVITNTFRIIVMLHAVIQIYDHKPSTKICYCYHKTSNTTRSRMEAGCPLGTHLPDMTLLVMLRLV